jgi:nucleoside-diphosphate-sugar epimerase
MKSLLLIGGAGFFGKSFLDCFQRGLLRKWDIEKVFIISRNPERLKEDAAELLDQRVQLIATDISTVTTLPTADYVIHAAASTDAKAYISQPAIEKQNIKSAIDNYCNLAPRFHNKSKILYVSSGAVYGYQPPWIELLQEAHAFNAIERLAEGKRDYAIAKKDAEVAFQMLGRNNMSTAIARCFAFVGPWLPRNQHFAIGNFIEDGILGRAIEIKASHTVYRSYMYADDLVHWLMTICDHANPECPVYNVGSDKAVTLVEAAGIVANKLNVEVSVPDIKLNEVDRYVPSILKAKTELGLTLSFNVQSAVAKTIDTIILKQQRV